MLTLASTNPRRSRFLLLPVAALAPLLLLAGCDTAGEGNAAQAQQQEQEEPLELGPYMSTMQRWSQKLGFALQQENQPLAEFYLTEIEETSGEVAGKFGVYEGMEISRNLTALLDPAVADLRQAIEEGDLQAATSRYEQMIGACNTCHAATQHPFIVITPASGEPPYNQDFAPLNRGQN